MLVVRFVVSYEGPVIDLAPDHRCGRYPIECAVEAVSRTSERRPGRGVSMDNLLGQSGSVRTPDAVAARVFSDAKRAFGGLADDALLERVARDAVDEFYHGSIKVTTFIPVLAMRRVRDLLESGPASLEAAGES